MCAEADLHLQLGVIRTQQREAAEHIGLQAGVVSGRTTLRL